MKTILVIAISLQLYNVVQCSCDNIDINMVLALDTTVKQTFRSKIIAAISPIVNMIVESGGRVGIIGFDNVAHPVTTLASELEGRAELIEMGKKFPWAVPLLKSPEKARTQSAEEILNMIFSYNAERPTVVNIGRALKTAEMMLLKNSDQVNSPRKTAQKLVVVISSKNSLDDPSAHVNSLRSNGVTLASVSLDMADLSSLASSSDMAFTADFLDETAESSAKLFNSLCKISQTQKSDRKMQPMTEWDRAAALTNNSCPLGYTGRFCEIMICPMKGNPVPFKLALYEYAIDVNVFDSCNKGHTSLFYVDSLTTTVNVMLVTSILGNPMLSIYKPNGQLLNMNETKNLMNSHATIYFDVPNPMAGTWKAVYRSQNPAMCIFGPNAITNFTIVPGFINGNQDHFLDNPSKYMYQGQPNFLIAHPVNLPRPGKITHMDLFEDYKLIWSSLSNVRYHCSYEYYFGVVYCNRARVYYYKVYGIDENGYNFQRSDSVVCKLPSSV